jgi:hypothetical protein
VLFRSLTAGIESLEFLGQRDRIASRNGRSYATISPEPNT